MTHFSPPDKCPICSSRMAVLEQRTERTHPYLEPSELIHTGDTATYECGAAVRHGWDSVGEEIAFTAGNPCPQPLRDWCGAYIMGDET